LLFTETQAGMLIIISLLVKVLTRDSYSFFKNSLSYNEEPDYVIGRSMYETDRIPSGWVDQCNDEVDEIWVPSHFNVDTFSKAGVNSSKLFVVRTVLDICIKQKAQSL
jgi:hypothetical protein